MSQKYLGENLIFIISLPRSGSTLLQRMLAGNPAVATSSEPWILLHPAYGRGAKHLYADYGVDWAQLGVDEFLAHYTDGPEVYDDGIRAFAQTIYANALKKAGGTYFLDKTPRYVIIVDDLLELFPAAKFIFLFRNPLSILASIVNTQISHDLTTLERFGKELMQGPANMLNGIEALGDKAVVLHYEKFVEDPEAALQMVCEKIGLEFSPAMLEYSKSPQLKGFMQDRTGVRQYDRPARERIESWRQILGDRQQLEFAQGYLRDLGKDVIERLGYNYADLHDTVQQAAAKVPQTYCLPWDVAIRTPHEKRGREQNQVFKYRSIRDYGPVLGRLVALSLYPRGLLRICKIVFGRAKPIQDTARKENIKPRGPDAANYEAD